jgi:phosphate transport system permease protein
MAIRYEKTSTGFPEGVAVERQVHQRQRRGALWGVVFMASTLVGIIALLALLYNVFDSAFGYVAIQNKIDPADLVAGAAADSDLANVQLAELPKQTLIEILEANVSTGLMRRLENDQPFAERSRENVYELVLERVVEPTIVRSWSLTDSLLRRSNIEAEVAVMPNAELTFRSWVTGNFLASPQSSKPEFAGVRTAIFGSLWVILITIVVALPVGVGAAIYLEEYGANNWFNRLVETNINNLAGVPSIIYGMLGLAIFVRALEPFTSGTLFGAGDPTTANGRTVLAAGLTMALLILPLIIINAREAIRAVPASLRQAGLGLGATQWQTIWSHVLPGALPGIMTGAILSISRAIGETAPLVVIGASTFIVVDPNGPFSKFTTLPIQIYQWTSRPQAEFRNLAAGAILVLLALLLTLNAAAILIRNRYTHQGN